MSVSRGTSSPKKSRLRLSLSIPVEGVDEMGEFMSLRPDESAEVASRLALTKILPEEGLAALGSRHVIDGIQNLRDSAGSGDSPNARFGGRPRLPVAFGAIVGGTEHLAVLSRASAALAPCGNMVRVHFGEFPYPALIGGMADCAERTI